MLWNVYVFWNVLLLVHVPVYFLYSMKATQYCETIQMTAGFDGHIRSVLLFDRHSFRLPYQQQCATTWKMVILLQQQLGYHWLMKNR